MGPKIPPHIAPIDQGTSPGPQKGPWAPAYQPHGQRKNQAWAQEKTQSHSPPGLPIDGMKQINTRKIYTFKRTVKYSNRQEFVAIKIQIVV